MEITGRITKNAEVKTLEGGAQMVNFSIAVNHSYYSKKKEKIIKEATFFDCSFGRSTSIAKYLTTGTIVELAGRVSARAWIDGNGKARAALSFRVQNINLLGGGKVIPLQEPAEVTEDMPF